METYILVGDKVVTSKGRFGKVTDTNGKESKVLIGSRIFEIFNSELLKLENSVALEIEYYIDYLILYDKPLKDILFINRKSILFNHSNPLDNPILLECNKILKKKLKIENKIIITKIQLA